MTVKSSVPDFRPYTFHFQEIPGTSGEIPEHESGTLSGPSPCRLNRGPMISSTPPSRTSSRRNSETDSSSSVRFSWSPTPVLGLPPVERHVPTEKRVVGLNEFFSPTTGGWGIESRTEEGDPSRPRPRGPEKGGFLPPRSETERTVRSPGNPGVPDSRPTPLCLGRPGTGVRVRDPTLRISLLGP